jgi:hypothetical protein
VLTFHPIFAMLSHNSNDNKSKEDEVSTQRQVIGGWVVEGSGVHHELAHCSKLEGEKARGGKGASYATFNHQVHTRCTECLKTQPQQSSD